MPKDNDPIEAAQKRQAEIVAEQEKAQSVQPTPTQEEADKAKLGLLDEDGSAAPEEDSEHTNKAESSDKPAGTYKTRAAKAD